MPSEQPPDLPIADGTYQARHVGDDLIGFAGGVEFKIPAPTHRDDPMSLPVVFRVAGGQLVPQSIKEQ